MPVEQAFTSYPTNYGPYLPGQLWPSLDWKTGETSLVSIEGMAPQHAAAALNKLVHWAKFAPTGDVALIDEVTAREEWVRRAPLGRALAARALGLLVGEDYALAFEPVDRALTVAQIIKALYQTETPYTVAKLEDALNPALRVLDALTERWMIVEIPT